MILSLMFLSNIHFIHLGKYIQVHIFLNFLNSMKLMQISGNIKYFVQRQTLLNEYSR